MNECESARRLGAWRDGRLSADEARAIEAHLKRCPVCAREAEELQRLSRFMASARLPALPDSTLDRLRGLGRRREEFTLVRLSEFVLAAAAMVLAACVGWLAWTSMPSAAVERRVPLWESAAVAPRAETAGTADAESYMARWIVADLGRGNDRD